jgi:hypothetical protein
LAYDPNSTIVPSLVCEPSLMFVPSSVPILVSFLDDDNDDPDLGVE